MMRNALALFDSEGPEGLNAIVNSTMHINNTLGAAFDKCFINNYTSPVTKNVIKSA